MEETVKQLAHYVAMLCELCVVLILVIAGVAAIVRAAICWRSYDQLSVKKELWLRFAASILLALEFALAADIADTVVAPTWEELGHLAAIAAIRTVLNYFLAKDIESAHDAGLTRPPV